GMDGDRDESALNMFKQLDLKGRVKDDTKLKTVHQNTITKIRIYESSGTAVSKFSSKSSLCGDQSEMMLTRHSERRRWTRSCLVRLIDQITKRRQARHPKTIRESLAFIPSLPAHSFFPSLLP